MAQHHLGSTGHGGAGPPGGCSSPCLNPPDSAPRGRISPFKGKAAAVSLNLSPAFGFLCASAIRELKPVFYFPFDLLESGAGMFYFRWHQLWPGGGRGGPSCSRYRAEHQRPDITWERAEIYALLDLRRRNYLYFFYLFPPAWALACGSSMRLVLCSVTLSPLHGDLGASEASCHLCVLVSISRE